MLLGCKLTKYKIETNKNETDYITSMTRKLVIQVGFCIEESAIGNQEGTARTFSTMSFIL